MTLFITRYHLPNGHVDLYYISCRSFEQATSLRMTLLQLADTGAILLIGWLLHRVSAGIEAELLAEHRGPGVR